MDDMGRQCNSINCEGEGICVFFEVHPVIIIGKFSFPATHEDALWGVRETKPPLSHRELHCCALGTLSEELRVFHFPR